MYISLYLNHVLKISSLNSVTIYLLACSFVSELKNTILFYFIQKYLKYQKTTVNENDDRGFVDRYLKKLNEDDKSDSFTEEQLIILLIDIMFPAFSGIPGVITHIIKYMMHHPRVMQKVQNEIDNVVGTGRLITWEDRKE